MPHSTFLSVSGLFHQISCLLRYPSASLVIQQTPCHHIHITTAGNNTTRNAVFFIRWSWYSFGHLEKAELYGSSFLAPSELCMLLFMMVTRRSVAAIGEHRFLLLQPSWSRCALVPINATLADCSISQSSRSAFPDGGRCCTLAPSCWPCRCLQR